MAVSSTEPLQLPSCEVAARNDTGSTFMEPGESRVPALVASAEESDSRQGAEDVAQVAECKAQHGSTSLARWSFAA